MLSQQPVLSIRLIITARAVDPLSFFADPDPQLVQIYINRLNTITVVINFLAFFCFYFTFFSSGFGSRREKLMRMRIHSPELSLSKVDSQFLHFADLPDGPTTTTATTSLQGHFYRVTTDQSPLTRV